MVILSKTSYFVRATFGVGGVTTSERHPNVYAAALCSATPLQWGDAGHGVVPHKHKPYSSEPLLAQYVNPANRVLHCMQFLIIKESP